LVLGLLGKRAGRGRGRRGDMVVGGRKKILRPVYDIQRWTELGVV
jgi:hypothetical protein